MSEISEDDLIVYKVLADRAAVTVPSYVIPKLADAMHKLLAECERLTAERDRYRKALGRIYTGTRPVGERSMSSIEIAALALHGPEADGGGS